MSTKRVHIVAAVMAPGPCAAPLFLDPGTSRSTSPYARFGRRHMGQSTPSGEGVARMAGGVGFVLLMKSATQNNKELFMINLAGWICLGVGLCYLLWICLLYTSDAADE